MSLYHIGPFQSCRVDLTIVCVNLLDSNTVHFFGCSELFGAPQGHNIALDKLNGKPQ